MPQECRSCKGTGKLPPIVHEDGSVTPAADCIQCDGAGNQETIEDISARVAQDEQWREGIETGEPMDLAWRLLKNEDELARYNMDSDQYDEEAHHALMDKWAEDTKQLLPTLSMDDVVDEKGNIKIATNSPYPPGHWTHKRGDWRHALGWDEESFDLFRPYEDEAERRREAIYEAEAREKAEREEKERMQQVQEKTRADKMRAMSPQITEITKRFQDAFKAQSAWLDVSDKPIPRSVINSVLEEERGHARIDEFPQAWKEALARIEEFQGVDEDIETGEPMDLAMRLLKSEMPTWDHIWAAGRAMEAGDVDPLTRLIIRIDNMGMSYSGERKAVDLMLNSGWSVEDTMNRMGRTYQGKRFDTAVMDPKHLEETGEFKQVWNAPPPAEVEMNEPEDDDRSVGDAETAFPDIPTAEMWDPDYDDKWRSNIEAGEPMDIAWQLLKYDFYYDKKRSGVQGVHYPPSRLDFTPIKGRKNEWGTSENAPALQESGENKRVDPSTRLTGGERPGHYVGVNIANLNPHPSMQEGQAFDQTAQMLGRNLTHEGVHALIEDEVREAAETPQQYTNMTEWGAHQAMFPGGQDQADLANRLYASHPHTTNVTTGEPMDLSWRLLKNPIMETDVPGVRMGYGRDAETEPLRRQGKMIGAAPIRAGKAKIRHMTPNEYFDWARDVLSPEMAAQMVDFHVPDDSEKPVGPNFQALSDKDKLKQMRWVDMDTVEPPEAGARKVADMIRRLTEEGHVMGMPEITEGQTILQDGGHRMEALRQMGYGDTKVPVYARHWENKDDALAYYRAMQEQAMAEASERLRGGR